MSTILRGRAHLGGKSARFGVYEKHGTPNRPQNSRTPYIKAPDKVPPRTVGNPQMRQMRSLAERGPEADCQDQHHGGEPPGDQPLVA